MPSLYIAAFIVFAGMILYNINNMTNKLCLQKEIPEEKQPGVFRTINVCFTILLISSFIKVTFT